VSVRLHTRVTRIQPDKKTVEIEGDEQLPYDYLVVATGATPRSLEVPGKDRPGLFYMRNLSDAIRIKKFIATRKCRSAALIGAGFVSLEMCEAFNKIGISPRLFDRKNLPMTRLGGRFGKQIVEELTQHDVLYLPDSMVERFSSSSNDEIIVHTNHGAYETDLVLIGIGVVPEVSLAAAAGIKIGPTGAIAVNEHMQTNIPNIYAAGDCCESFHRVSGKSVHLPLGDIANKQGRVAGANIGGQKIAFPGIVGSNCFKLFNLEIASTGLTLREANETGFKADAVTIEGRSKPHGYPGAEKIWLQMVAEKESGRILGAHVIGKEGAVNRINIVASALTAGLRVADLAYLDLAYAPPFSGAWDPLHIAAQRFLK
jgi:NADPH-dependent 2,4-dienoyl-CoA reductase/sulfur reductase-like enzyme